MIYKEKPIESKSEGGISMNRILKGLLITILIVYVVSPIDFCPGPIDDIILVLISMASNKGLETKEG